MVPKQKLHENDRNILKFCHITAYSAYWISNHQLPHKSRVCGNDWIYVQRIAAAHSFEPPNSPHSQQSVFLFAIALKPDSLKYNQRSLHLENSHHDKHQPHNEANGMFSSLFFSNSPQISEFCLLSKDAQRKR